MSSKIPKEDRMVSDRRGDAPSKYGAGNWSALKRKLKYERWQFIEFGGYSSVGSRIEIWKNPRTGDKLYVLDRPSEIETVKIANSLYISYRDIQISLLEEMRKEGVTNFTFGVGLSPPTPKEKQLQGDYQELNQEMKRFLKSTLPEFRKQILYEDWPALDRVGRKIKNMINTQP